MERTKPHGRVVGIDLLPAAPPKGVSTIQGNFLNLATRNLVKDYLQEYAQRPPVLAPAWNSGQLDQDDVSAFIRGERSYIDSERADTAGPQHDDAWAEIEGDEGKLVDVRSRATIDSPTSPSSPLPPSRLLTAPAGGAQRYVRRFPRADGRVW